MERNLSRTLRKRRMEIGLTQSEVAAYLGFKSADYIGLVEQGLRNMDLDKIPSLAEVLRLDSVEMCKKALEQQYPVFSRCLLRGKGIRGSYSHSAEVVNMAARLIGLPVELRQMVVNMVNVLYENECRSRVARVA